MAGLTSHGIHALAMDVTDDAAAAAGRAAGHRTQRPDRRAGQQRGIRLLRNGRAAASRRPRTRYITGFGAHPLLLARRVLPDRAFDQVMTIAYKNASRTGQNAS
jgi:hypothetical protein